MRRGLPEEPPPERDGAGELPEPLDGSARGIVRGVSLAGASVWGVGRVSRPAFTRSFSMVGRASRERLLVEFAVAGRDAGCAVVGLPVFPSRPGLATPFACEGRLELVNVPEGLDVDGLAAIGGLGAVSSSFT